jgi:hypothetical protein
MAFHPHCHRFSGWAGLLAGLTMAALAGCASSPPVQVMSDARQAVRAAEDDMTPTTRERAARLLEEARQALEAGEYGHARKRAEEARQLAHQAGNS